MFEKFKQLKQLKDLQDKLSQEKEEVEKNGIKIVINGKLEVESIQLNSALEKEKQEKLVKECFNDVIKKIQFKLATKMSKMPGLGF